MRAQATNGKGIDCILTVKYMPNLIERLFGVKEKVVTYKREGIYLSGDNIRWINADTGEVYGVRVDLDKLLDEWTENYIKLQEKKYKY